MPIFYKLAISSPEGQVKKIPTKVEIFRLANKFASIMARIMVGKFLVLQIRASSNIRAFILGKCRGIQLEFVIKLSKYKNFLDLGSGDGRIALIASLFTKSAGIEYDLALARASGRMGDILKLKADFINDDYMKQDLSKYDIIFWYPDDQRKGHVERKLLKEMEGRLIIYRNIYTPKKLKNALVMDRLNFAVFINRTLNNDPL